MQPTTKIILITGSRTIRDVAEAQMKAELLLSRAAETYGEDNIRVLHGDAEGWDSLFRDIVEAWDGMMQFGYPAGWFDSPLLRNHHMCKVVANLNTEPDVECECWAFASRWASGTGNCARTARRMGIHTVDYGVCTLTAHRPRGDHRHEQ